ncbi:hypothetical protein QTG54_002221 [Skeletonema marinoi]|uniref:Uncharacterized protein n=1 Tax=Skeletonema marinoi TaxID=267567 RepID=A0AAD9DH16_9STRA|nr:hypothetical protein QTG54_002221 [Skeletonema marinoi]
MWLSSPSRSLLITQLLFQLCRPSSQFSATVEQKTSPPPLSPAAQTVDNPNIQLDGTWSTAKQALRNPNCCVISISGLDHHLSILQSYFCGVDAPSDVDLRMRVRCCGNSTNSSTEISYVDCANVYHTIMDPPSTTGWNNNNNNNIATSDINTAEQTTNDNNPNNPCIQALQELALGVHSLTDGPLQRTVTDIHMRVVCASTYSANDPPFHTDKCQLRGYVTLVGPGTEYMDGTCRPWEYVALRSLGVDGLGLVNGEGRLKMAEELEFIVMKGDYYDASVPEDDNSNNSSMMSKKKLWSRAEACVHRSPPGNNAKRVILSLDLADGGDDQEWEERGRKRNWRVGMTQRKSHLTSNNRGGDDQEWEERGRKRNWRVGMTQRKTKQALRNPNCSVVSISGLDHHLSTLQSYFCGENAPSDVDLRMRVRCCGDGTNSSTEISYVDCASVYHTIVDAPSPTGWKNNNNKITTSDINTEQPDNSPNNPCIQALQELALGVHSLTDGPLQRTVTDIHMRVVCASTYSANDPPFHTDKCQLRGYVTLVGPGTEYMDGTCRPWEYVALRSLGVDGLGLVNGEGRLKMARELEFIVMKGDYYDASVPKDDNNNSSSMSQNKKKLWSKQKHVCIEVHRGITQNVLYFHWIWQMEEMIKSGKREDERGIGGLE